MYGLLVSLNGEHIWLKCKGVPFNLQCVRTGEKEEERDGRGHTHEVE